MKTKKIRVNYKKAVKIARDVIAQIRVNRFIPESGIYCHINGKSYDNCEDFQEVFEIDKSVTCEVCALGSLFASLVRFDGKKDINTMENACFDDIFQHLSSVFHPRDLLLMEHVFELGVAGRLSDYINNRPLWCFDDTESGIGPNEIIKAPFYFSWDEIDRAISYGLKYRDDKSQRLRAIMLNVIRNNGRFVLPQRIR